VSYTPKLAKSEGWGEGLGYTRFRKSLMDIQPGSTCISKKLRLVWGPQTLSSLLTSCWPHMEQKYAEEGSTFVGLESMEYFQGVTRPMRHRMVPEGGPIVQSISNGLYVGIVTSSHFYYVREVSKTGRSLDGEILTPELENEKKHGGSRNKNYIRSHEPTLFQAGQHGKTVQSQSGHEGREVNGIYLRFLPANPSNGLEKN